jgi:hypothetical protein
MLRQLIAAALALAIAVPLPALAGLAGTGCTMDTPALAAERCECCTASMATGHSQCGATSGASGCGCELRADTRPDSRSAVSSTTAPTVTFSVDGELIPADLSTPGRTQRRIALAASPPGAGALVSRPILCSWII